MSHGWKEFGVTSRWERTFRVEEWLGELHTSYGRNPFGQKHILCGRHALGKGQGRSFGKCFLMRGSLTLLLVVGGFKEF